MCGEIKYYYRLDHLGNVREVWRSSTGNTVQYTQYYPSGLPWASNSGDNPGKQNKKYNGKEFVEMHGYDTYDIVWRQYYPAIGRFQTPDPEIEDAYNESPYAMCDNNMVNRTDPDGRFWANVLGGIVSGGIDYAGQVAGNLTTGQSLGKALTDVSYGSIAVSAFEGVLNPIGGVSKASLKAAAKFTVGSVVKTTLKEGAKSAAGQVLDNAFKGKELSKDVAVTAIVGGVAGNLKMAPNSPKANQTKKELTAAVKNGKTLSPKQAGRLAQAKAERSSNQLTKRTTDYVAGSNAQATTNIIKDEKKK